MCGIFGVWHFDGQPVDLAEVQRATNILHHRGPDDEGYLLVNTKTGHTVSCGGRDTEPRLRLSPIEDFVGKDFDVAVGFRRLSIIDVSPAGHQPMGSPDGRFWIALNGEIYNYMELRAELSAKGYQFHSDTDTEVVLAACQEWGDKCLSRFNGMWAFVLWDGVETRLFMARDRFGIKPLYYTTHDRSITFASEIKAFVGRHGIPFQPNEEAVYQYLVAGRLPSPRGGETFFQDVHALPPGHSLTVRDHVVRTHQYWSLDTVTSKGGRLSAAESAAKYRRLLSDAVRLRLRADVPLGSCLSGGVDSSSIVCVVNHLWAREGQNRDEIGDQQRTFSAVYDTVGPHNEIEHIEKVLQATGAEGHFTLPTLERLREDFARIVWHLDEPFLSTSIFAQWCVMGEACTQGVKVLLDGQGADELLAGYGPYSTFLVGLMRQARIVDALGQARAIQARTGLPAPSLFAGALRYLLPYQVFDAVRRRWYAWQHDWSVLNQDFAARWHHATIAHWEPSFEHQDLQRHLRYLLEESSLPHLLRYEDRNSMAFGIEARVPYLDHRLVELCFGDVAPWRIRDGWTKWVLRKAVEGLVPDEIAWRRDKVGFQTPETAWLVSWMCEEPDFFGRASLASAYLDFGTIRGKIALWSQNRGKAPNLPVWRWLNLELWLRLFSDQASFRANPSQ